MIRVCNEAYNPLTLLTSFTSLTESRLLRLIRGTSVLRLTSMLPVNFRRSPAFWTGPTTLVKRLTSQLSYPFRDLTSMMARPLSLDRRLYRPLPLTRRGQTPEWSQRARLTRPLPHLRSVSRRHRRRRLRLAGPSRPHVVAGPLASRPTKVGTTGT